MGCVLTKEDYEEEKKYSPSSSNDCNSYNNSEPLPLIEPIRSPCSLRKLDFVTQRIIYEEKIKKIYYIEYYKQNDRRYKN